MGGERIPLQKKNPLRRKHRLFSKFECIRNDAHQRRRSLVYSQILQSYDDVRIRTNALERPRVES
ncbi:hypothetical protein CK203_064496 [Vitis vinifera]|uniref:Uncharacterized protein n=1 Tax=Vitis vinifera TaxID=29760 RepID=A0A438G8M2_VITVI|nr:hypothetical protein CK203_064496 [Vitis vinifera]